MHMTEQLHTTPNRKVDYFSYETMTDKIADVLKPGYFDSKSLEKSSIIYVSTIEEEDDEFFTCSLVEIIDSEKPVQTRLL